MTLRVRSKGRCDSESDRAATDKSVQGITSPGDCWAVDAKVENSNSHQLRAGSIVRFWGTREAAEADAARIRAGEEFYKNTGRKYFDPFISRAEAYLA
ncbi:hypothetical protein [Mycolicibacterium sp. lyk4-40-TYG-92]|uniref:hypothetical protein n=1 Tax=Mycolicibacterium sp. lyk4-40-TYG-92 TaxID=3040295 RepID=UPI00254EBCC7|nr:hypothetical protein [Mycolicibacterium sp. lyk4-40-TYG-92]